MTSYKTPFKVFFVFIVVIDERLATVVNNTRAEII